MSHLLRSLSLFLSICCLHLLCYFKMIMSRHSSSVEIVVKYVVIYFIKIYLWQLFVFFREATTVWARLCDWQYFNDGIYYIFLLKLIYYQFVFDRVFVIWSCSVSKSFSNFFPQSFFVPKANVPTWNWTLLYCLAIFVRNSPIISIYSVLFPIKLWASIWIDMRRFG